MTKSIKTVGVCGAAGTMGAGIALVAARAGYRTISYDRTSPPLEKAAQQSSAFLDKSVERAAQAGRAGCDPPLHESQHGYRCTSGM
jgi:3-hydroxyacyl-CoA dehydrogenase